MIYYTPSTGPDIDALRDSFKKIGEIVQAKKLTETAILVPQKSNLGGIIQDLLGESTVKCLLKSHQVDLDGLLMRLFTGRRMPRFFNGPIIAAYIDIKSFSELIKACPTSDIVFVPWTEDERDEFIRRWGADATII